jgi:light-regulated signal transduction histidine kinase (bacteriophytochrome)
VQFVSENAAEMLGIAAADIIDRSYLALTDAERERRVMKDAIVPDTILFANPFRMTIKGRAFDAVVHSINDTHMIELELVDPAAAAYADMASRAVEDLHDPGSVDELYQRAVRQVREATGFDRVMLYRFDPRYNGQVLAESSREGIGSFLGLFFPSSDIGARVRQLYLRNFTRYIPDIGGTSFAMVGGHPSGAASRIDMSDVNLRSVATCHIDYLANMGVQASMSFSINVDDRLWGLFACHHYAPRLVSYDQRVVCEQTAMMFIYKLSQLNSVAARLAQRAVGVQQISRSLQVGAALARRITALEGAWAEPDDQLAARPMLLRALAALHAETSWLIAPDLCADGEDAAPSGEAALLTSGQRLLLDLVEADSAAIVRHGQVRRIGDAPSVMAIYAIASMFGRELPDLQHGNLPVFATDNLTGMAPVAAAIKDRAAGVLAVSLSDDTPAYLMWFRREQIVHAAWAGNPVDEARAAGATTANPRASFAAWKADIRDLSRAWVLEDVEIADALMSAIRRADGTALASVAPPPVATAQWPAARLAPVPARPPAPPPAPVGQARRVIRVGQV